MKGAPLSSRVNTGDELEVILYGAVVRRYADPVHVLQTDRREAVAATLHQADEALQAGYSIAGYLTYEAGAALEGIATPNLTNGEPLLAIGVYTGPSATLPASFAAPARIGPLVTEISRARYESDLARIARALHDGDVYQVNYTVPFDFTCTGDPLALFNEIRRRASVSYAAYVRHDARVYASLSPELFIKIDGTRLRTKPMKGTSVDARDLRSAKNRAEHIMIVDLLRNDLHKVCDDVRVPRLFEVERFPTFATMTSTIEGTLKKGRRLDDIFAAMFPCGSITGAPKRAAIREIAACEAAPRGIAMGTIGYCEPPRRGTWNVAIRTLAIDTNQNRGTVRIGGGIVADSTPSHEWAEILVKRRVFDRSADRTSLIETMLARSDGSVSRLERHLERLERSAFALGLTVDMAQAKHAIFAASSSQRNVAELLRLEATSAAITVRQRPLEPTPQRPRVCIAPTTLLATDPALRHKTSCRSSYDAAEAYARAHGCFEALLLNESGHVADGSRTTIFVASGGMLLTPRLRDGALAGVLRAELLESGRAIEAVIDLPSLQTGDLYIGSSARGLVRAKLCSSASAV